MPKRNIPRPEPAPKAFDVFKPGKSLASPTSRPVIAGHKPEVHDSTLTDRPGKLVPERHSGGELLDVHDKVTISVPTSKLSVKSSPQPVTAHEPLAGVLPTAGELEAPVEVLPLTPTEPEGPPQETVEPERPVTNELDTVPSESPVTAHDIPASDQAPAVMPDIGVGVAQIVVSHHKPVRTHSTGKTLLVILLAVVVIVAAVDGILDAGVWAPSINIPHTHFSNR